jgi:hypothetical protein
MMSSSRLALILFGVASVSSCGGSGDAGAGGEAVNSRILEGSVSDEMVPYDTLRSEPPAAKIVDEDGKGSGASGSSGTGPGAISGPSDDATNAISPSPAETPESAAPTPPEG